MLSILKNHFAITDNMDEIANHPECKEYFAGKTMAPFVFVVHCLEGSICFTFNDNVHQTLQPHDHLFVPPYFKISDYSCSNDFKGFLACFHGKIFHHEMADSLLLQERHIFKIWENAMSFNVYSFTRQQENLFCSYFNFLHALQVYDSEIKIADNTLKSILQPIASLVVSIIRVQSGISDDEDEDSTVRRSDYVYSKFLDIIRSLEKPCPIEKCAENLHVSSKYLNDICKRKAGKTAHKLMAGVQMEKIKQRLATTTDDVAQICHQFNFSSESNFCKYVKKHLGMSPLEYRKSLRNK